MYPQVNHFSGLSTARADVLYLTVDSEVKKRIENDIRNAQQDMEMYEKEKVEINQGIKQIGEEEEVFKQRLVRLIFLALTR